MRSSTSFRTGKDGITRATVCAPMWKPWPRSIKSAMQRARYGNSVCIKFAIRLATAWRTAARAWKSFNNSSAMNLLRCRGVIHTSPIKRLKLKSSVFTRNRISWTFTAKSTASRRRPMIRRCRYSNNWWTNAPWRTAIAAFPSLPGLARIPTNV